MSSIAWLFIGGIAVYIVLMWILNPLLDNKTELDLEEEQRLTDKY